MRFYPKFIFLLLLFFSCAIKLTAQNKTTAHTVFLIGDAGNDTLSGRALLLLQEQLNTHPGSTVIFLGDNVYPKGLILNDLNSEKRLLSQLKILDKHKGEVFFIPGNHDWKAGRYKGLTTIKDQAQFVNNYMQKNTTVKNKDTGTFFPEKGFPGPVSKKLPGNLRLIMVDTQWWLQFYPVGKNGTRRETEKQFFTELDSLLNQAKLNNEQVIIAAHHPLYSNGSHTKNRQPIRFMVNYTPFQVLGIMGLNRLLVQDLPQGRYNRMRNHFLEIIDKYENIIYAAGHEHNLQYFIGKNNRFIVSGAGSKKSGNCREAQKCKFIDGKKTGFFKINYFEDDKISVEVLRIEQENEVIETY